MQDPYSTMMGSQQRVDQYKSYQASSTSRLPSTAIPTSTTNSSFFDNLSYSALYGNPENFQSMTLPHSTLSQEFSSLPSHMSSQESVGSSNGVSRMHSSTTHTITHPATSQVSTSPSAMSNISSPLPSTSNVNVSPDGHSQNQMSNTSPVETSGIKRELKREHELGISDNNSDKSGNNEEEPGMPPKKRQNVTPEDQRDDGYWEKRKKNNESAKRSREARRIKEEQIALRVVYLEQENLQLRTEVSLLKSEIEKLRCMLYNT